MADLETGRPGGYVMLRADMDALPVPEPPHIPHHSQNPGYSHCCGHDGHSACLLGAARVLNALRDELTGRIRFVFKPAEEISRGALEMIEAGVLSDRLPDAIFAMHTWPRIQVGDVGCRPGTITAGSDSFTIRVIGEGGHGARPWQANSPLPGISRLIKALSEMATGERVVSPCVTRAGNKLNVIPEYGELSGTVRTLNRSMRDRTLSQMQEVSHRVCSELGLEVEVDFEAGCPPVVIKPEMYELFHEVGAKLLGEEHVVRLADSSMGSEDFGHYLSHVPGLLFRLGMGMDSPELHNPRFDFNDAALESGITMMAGLAMRVCNGERLLTG